MEQLPVDPENLNVNGATKGVASKKAGPRGAASWFGVGIRLFILLLIGALVLVLAREWDWWVGSSTLQSTDDAYLQADTTPLAAKVPGYVSRVPVQDFQRVHAGDLLVEIVDDDYRAQLDQAHANVNAAGAAIENIEQAATARHWIDRAPDGNAGRSLTQRIELVRQAGGPARLHVRSGRRRQQHFQRTYCLS